MSQVICQALLPLRVSMKLIERHYTLDRAMVGFDHKMFLEPDELIAMVRDIRAIKRSCCGRERVSDTE